MCSVILWEPTFLQGSRWTWGRTWNSVLINSEWVRLPPCHWPKDGLSVAKWLLKHFVSYFLLPYSISKQISIVVLIVFQGRYPGTITILSIRQLQWIDTKATSKNLIIFFWKTTSCSKDWPKSLFSSYLRFYLRLLLIQGFWK